VAHVALSSEAPSQAASGVYWARGQPDVGSPAARDDALAEALLSRSLAVRGWMDVGSHA
jgi:hypothetical protein